MSSRYPTTGYASHSVTTVKSLTSSPRRRSSLNGSSSKNVRFCAKRSSSPSSGIYPETGVGGEICCHRCVRRTKSKSMSDCDWGSSSWYSGWPLGRWLYIVICIAAVTMCQW
jgi:hypothetical protein